jgi:iron complex transport system ATP-binding protein
MTSSSSPPTAGTTSVAVWPYRTGSPTRSAAHRLSMALAQGTEILLLDEPTTYLDLSHQIDVLDLVARLHRERGRTIVMVLHDLNLAARYADHVVAMRDGRIAAQGPPSSVSTPALLSAVFGLEALVVPDPVTGTPMVVPLPRERV